MSGSRFGLMLMLVFPWERLDGWFTHSRRSRWFVHDSIREVRTDAEISDAVCWNEQGEMPPVWRSQMHHLFPRLS
jgi:hypothetical protein